MDMAALGADWYVWSAYKVYGPHMAARFGRMDAIDALEGPNHCFIPRTDIPYKFEAGGVPHESCAGLLALRDHLCLLASLEGEAAVPAPAGIDRPAVERAFAVMTACEIPLQARLVRWIQDHPRLRLIGPAAVDESRVPTVSFVHAGKSSREIASHVNQRGIGIRHGHMYAWRLCSALGIPPEDGVVRISAVHSNTPEEVERVISALEEVV